MSVFYKKIPEIVVEGKRLGRHIEHDERSLLYAPATAPIKTVTHPSVGLPLNQGQIGSCTANALCGALNSSPEQTIRTEADAVTLYGRETSDEGNPYPPNDPGGSGIAVCKAAQELGWISSYSTPVVVQQALGALVLRPVITGVNWYTSFDTPDESGLVVIADGATVRGGHEFVADGIDADKKLVWFWNSWGTEYGVGGKFCMSWDTWSQLLSEGGDVTVPMP